MKSIFSKSDRLWEHLDRSILLEETGIPYFLRLTVIFSAALVVAFLAWASVMRIDETAVAPGEIIPSGRSLAIQHAKGGRVAEVLIQEGETVEAGAPLIKLDTDAAVARLDQLTSQLGALSSRAASTSKKLEVKRKLYKQGLTSQIAVMDLEEEETEIKSRLVATESEVASLRSEIEKSTLRAPAQGRVLGLRPTGPGSVISPGETVLEIVPEGAPLVVEVRIAPRDIGHVRKKQDVLVKFSAYEFAKFGGLAGRIENISASTVPDRAGNPTYRAIVSLARQDFPFGETPLPLIAGMTVTADIKTGSKTLMQYMIRPISSSARQAFHEK